MTQTETIQALNTGVKISHSFFDDHEYIMKDSNGNLIDEDGTHLIESLFWQVRDNKYWQKNWKIFIPNT